MMDVFGIHLRSVLKISHHAIVKSELERMAEDEESNCFLISFSHCLHLTQTQD